MRVLQALHEALQLEKAHSVEMGQVFEVVGQARDGRAVLLKSGSTTAGSPVSVRLAAQEAELENERAVAAATFRHELPKRRCRRQRQGRSH